MNLHFGVAYTTIHRRRAGVDCKHRAPHDAPRATVLSVRVLGSDNRGKGLAFATGLQWAIERGASIVNLSLSSRSESLYGTLHDLVDRAYFANVLLVCAANNVAVASYPSLFASVVSVAAHDVRDPDV